MTEEGECFPSLAPSEASFANSSSFANQKSLSGLSHLYGQALEQTLEIRGFFGVFDGYGGRDVANYVEAHIFDAFLKQCQRRKGGWQAGAAVDAMRKAFTNIEAEVLQQARQLDWVDGTTAAVVAVV